MASGKSRNSGMRAAPGYHEDLGVDICQVLKAGPGTVCAFVKYRRIQACPLHKGVPLSVHSFWAERKAMTRALDSHPGPIVVQLHDFDSPPASIFSSVTWVQ